MVTSETAPRDLARPDRNLALPALTAMVVGSMVGAGVFSLPRNFAMATGVYGALIAWAIAGTGMLMLAFVFQKLALRKPGLDAGIYAYAKAGFGEFPGFFSAFGYWASACVGNVTYWTLIRSTLGLLFPGLGEGEALSAVAASVVGVWLFVYLISRGVSNAAIVNQIVTIAKIVPILVFIVIIAVTLQSPVFGGNLWGGGPGEGLFEQVRQTMLLTVFVFIGVEGASIYSRYARRRKDVGRATVLGFLSVLALFASVTVLSYGALPRGDLGGLQQPSMAGVLESVVGTWGTRLVGAGLIVSVLGAYLAWTLMAAEVLYIAAKDRDMPAFINRTNRHAAPISALILTGAVVTVFLFVSMFSEDAFTFTLELCSALILIPYLLSAAYALKLAVTGETYVASGASDASGAEPVPVTEPESRRKELVIAALATLYTAFLIVGAGPEYLLLSCIIYVPGTILFVMARRERGKAVFTPPEAMLFGLIVLGAITAIICLATGIIVI
jgi:arginine:ornithine antiporter/lysine permease